MLFCRLLFFLFKNNFWKNSFRNTIRVSNSLDPDQAWHSLGPDLGPNCLQRLLSDDTRGKEFKNPFTKARVFASLSNFACMFFVLCWFFFIINFSTNLSGLRQEDPCALYRSPEFLSEERMFTTKYKSCSPTYLSPSWDHSDHNQSLSSH